MNHPPISQTWACIGLIVLFSTSGDVFLARSMSRIGDLGQVFEKSGMMFLLKTIFTNTSFMIGVSCMTGAFFSLLLALQWADLSLVVPASASLTFVGNALCANYFLHEQLDRKRWTSVVLVVCGVALLAK
jgi:drug/metabolite transporter (DMT)-like permease